MQWLYNYEANGIDGITTSTKDKKYSNGLKIRAVIDYLDGGESHLDICKKYGIRSTSQLREWIMKYNSHDGLKSFKTVRGTIMTKARKTTYE